MTGSPSGQRTASTGSRATRTTSNPELHLNIIYDDTERRGFRIKRLQSGAAYSQDPQSKLNRIIGNIRIEPSNGDEIKVRSNFNVTHLRRGHLDTYSGTQLHTLRREDGQLKVALRKVLLLQNDEPLNNITFLL